MLAVRRAAEWRSLRLQNARLRTEAALGRTIVADSPAMKRVMDVVARVAPKDVTVLLTGESGAGKDVVATVLHAHSRRADKPLVRFNAAAIPSELAEAEPLFGLPHQGRSSPAPRRRDSATSSKPTGGRSSSTK